MSTFIEIEINGKQQLINTDIIEKIQVLSDKEDKGKTYITLKKENTLNLTGIKTDTTYASIKNQILQ